MLAQQQASALFCLSKAMCRRDMWAERAAATIRCQRRHILDYPAQGHPKVQATFARVSGYVEQTDIHSPAVRDFHHTRWNLTLGRAHRTGHRSRAW